MFTKNTLNFIDIIILAMIFFGVAIISSTNQFFQLQQTGLSQPTTLEFTAFDNYQSIILELIYLSLAGLYLRFRQFNWKQLNFSINRYTLPMTILLIIIAGSIATIFSYIFQIFTIINSPEIVSEPPVYTPSFGFSLILFSLLNGFYEELFFLGLIFAVQKQYLNQAIIFSLVVRFLFHTYQGLAGAMAITILGITFLLFRQKTHYLIPFMLAHAFFDVFGLGLPYHWFI